MPFCINTPIDMRDRVRDKVWDKVRNKVRDKLLDEQLSGKLFGVVRRVARRVGLSDVVRCCPRTLPRFMLQTTPPARILPSE